MISKLLGREKWLITYIYIYNLLKFEITDGIVEEFKEKMETDEQNKTITLIALGGHVLDLYKSYKVVFKCLPRSEGTGLVKITLEYEKQNENVPAPTKYLNFLVQCINDIDAHILKS